MCYMRVDIEVSCSEATFYVSEPQGVFASLGYSNLNSMTKIDAARSAHCANRGAGPANI